MVFGKADIFRRLLQRQVIRVVCVDKVEQIGEQSIVFRLSVSSVFHAFIRTLEVVVGTYGRKEL